MSTVHLLLYDGYLELLWKHATATIHYNLIENRKADQRTWDDHCRDCDKGRPETLSRKRKDKSQKGIQEDYEFPLPQDRDLVVPCEAKCPPYKK